MKNGEWKPVYGGQLKSNWRSTGTQQIPAPHPTDTIDNPQSDDPPHATTGPEEVRTPPLDTGLKALAGIAGYYRIPADPDQLRHELAIKSDDRADRDLIRAARHLGLKAKLSSDITEKRLKSLAVPAIARQRDGKHVILVGRLPSGNYRVVDPAGRSERQIPAASLLAEIEPRVILLARRFGGQGIDPKTFSFRWFFPTIWRYRHPLGHVLLASLLVQIFALATPLIFQVIIDKVLTHKNYSSLYVLIGGLVAIAFFDMVLQYLRTYALTHTSNRIDVELGRRLFRHLLRLPVSYFESRPAGQTVARMRELETIRSFMTGQGLFATLDFLFVFVFISVLFLYSTLLACIVVATIPVFFLIAIVIGPGFRAKLERKFQANAESQQFLVESVVGMQTIKAAAVEPSMAAQWEERLAHYVGTAFSATMIGAKGQNTIQFISKLSSSAILLFGAQAVMDGSLTIGELVAFNMIAAQVAQPVLRLSQIWQDFQQVQISTARLGDILNMPTEPMPAQQLQLPPPRGQIEFRNVTFSYAIGRSPALKQVSLRIQPGEVIGIVGPSGSGKSTLAKLVQRFYVAEEGQILIDDFDISQVNPAWLRGHIGVVLQENLLFNRSIHDNIALADPSMPRAQVAALARLAGADGFISRLPQGYDTILEERGANLSGGQRQRIAIARALTTNPRILIFDEATSALDYESEQIIQSNMQQIVRNRTVLIIAHRLAAVRHCHRIISLNEGRIVEVGTHDQLLKNPGGLYARLWSLQTQRAAS